ncbi:MAG TPA: hypothetical protein VK591_15795 [Xanthobacteraceae bacterium]|nr:hypothetical protein [Xanthobacteraceae bacterium]
MMAKQSEFFASRTVKIRAIDGADYRSPARGAAGGKQLRLLLPINLAYDVHAGSHG